MLCNNTKCFFIIIVFNKNSKQNNSLSSSFTRYTNTTNSVDITARTIQLSLHVYVVGMKEKMWFCTNKQTLFDYSL